MRVLKEFKHLFRGSSFPTEVLTEDALRCVLKMRGAGNGARSLIAEFVVNRMGHSLGWQVPDAFPVKIPADFPWTFGTDEFDDLVRGSYGINLGLQWIEDAVPQEIQSLSEELRQKLVAIDAFFCNYDRLSSSGNILVDAAKKTWIVDHGSCRFLERAIALQSIQLAEGHVFKTEMESLLDKSLLAALSNPGKLRTITHEIPQEWLIEVGMTRSQVLENLVLRSEAVLNLR